MQIGYSEYGLSVTLKFFLLKSLIFMEEFINTNVSPNVKKCNFVPSHIVF